MTALGLPGRVTTRVPFESIPITDLDKHAIPVILRASLCIIWFIESALRVSILATASGVTSRGAKPVPPDVRIKLILLSDATACLMAS